MRLAHAGHPGRAVRLAYCLNLHPSDDLDGLMEGLRTITLPLRERLAPGREFGVGMYLPARVAAALMPSEGDAARERLRAFLSEHGLDPFTFNAFPFGDFQRDGLKQRVFEPTWAQPERVRFTTNVAIVASQLATAASDDSGRHLSISTHTGLHSAGLGEPQVVMDCARNLVLVASLLAEYEQSLGRRIVLSLEPEPRANCNDLADLARQRAAIVELNPAAREVLDRHLGSCVDACHAAVEYEPVDGAFDNATAAGAPLGKLQFTSALALVDPARNGAGRERLLALDEPRFLHQVTGYDGRGLVRVGDLPELAAAWERGDEAWRGAQEWRCHFHVPVDLERFGVDGLGTTRAYADQLLARALERPERWGTSELHVEIETYTWDVLPQPPRSPSALVDGLEREYRHVLACLAQHGWLPA